MDHLGLDLGTTTISAAVLDADGRAPVHAHCTGRCCRRRAAVGAQAGCPRHRARSPVPAGRAAAGISGHRLRRPDRPDARHRLCGRGGAAALAALHLAGRDGAQPGPDGKSTAARLTARTGYPLASGYGLVTLACHQAAGTIPDGAAPSARSRTISPCGCPAEARRASRPPWPPASACLTEQTLTARPSAGRDCRNSSCRRSRRRQNWAADGCVSLPRSATIRPASSARGQGRLDAPLVNIGTGSQFSFFTKEHRTVPGLETRPFPGGWLLTGAPLCGRAELRPAGAFFPPDGRAGHGNALPVRLPRHAPRAGGSHAGRCAAVPHDVCRNAAGPGGARRAQRTG